MTHLWPHYDITAVTVTLQQYFVGWLTKTQIWKKYSKKDQTKQSYEMLKITNYLTCTKKVQEGSRKIIYFALRVKRPWKVVANLTKLDWKSLKLKHIASAIY